MKKTVSVVIATCIGIFLCMLDTTIMNIALPAIQIGLNVNLSDLSWALNIYTILFATLTIPLSKLAERVGINRFYLIGLVTFALGSLVSAFATNIVLLDVGRAIQSVGAATVFPLSMTIGISTVDTSNRPKVIAALGVTQGLAAALGPVIGGIVTQFLSWRWIFLINIPLMILVLLLVTFNLSMNQERNAKPIDLQGCILSMITLFSLTLLLIKGREWGWTSFSVICLVISFLAGCIAFVFTEHFSKNPMVPLDLFKSRQFVGASVAIVLSNLFLVGVTVILPTYFTNIQQKTELTAALIITPITVMIFIFSTVAALIIDKVGARIVVLLGFVLMAVGYAMFFTVNLYNSLEVFVACTILGTGYGIIAGPITVLAAADFTGEKLNSSQSVAGVLRQVGVVLAVAIFVTNLYAGLASAKVSSVQFASGRIQRLTIPQKQKSMMLKTTKDAISTGKTHQRFPVDHFSKIERRAMIHTNYVAAVSRIISPSNSEKVQIMRQVKKKVDLVLIKQNHNINAAIGDIQTKSESYFTNAFKLLYRNTLPFLFFAILASFIFPAFKREKVRNVRH
ncbi:MFS transporter [Lacticaseibacillus casei]|jgi:EmrB/QacA subfamily drug resistance transporter|uniref:MFS transporter n=1 Tax=Lacticaseibacillus huelsenbergensis TaxID=3035291 RepID=A0ABY8DWJ5_9LACO|nr:MULTISPECIES: MFS transporter [Lacticaseibacillus]MDG3062405.1 MFS transporter [Lacticaseibacillus sp. BCRC 81376]QVI36354.1 MFS transporter [Lacticaseibacillus casei]QXG58153.1 MFS transporter [Lacticaseibacillus casei]WFB40372.1 MFS transporter [Lacticaseibacillus huelsenbergensis]WFB42125.1 MFS transporter [Lacticaseibacillus huelsenbergensis]